MLKLKGTKFSFNFHTNLMNIVGVNVDNIHLIEDIYIENIFLPEEFGCKYFLGSKNDAKSFYLLDMSRYV